MIHHEIERRAPGERAMARLGPGQPARNEKAHRAQCVGSPDRVVCRGRPQTDEERAQRGPVEPQGADELDARRPPVDPVMLHREAAIVDPAVPHRRASSARGRFVVLEERGRREEDGPDEEREVVRRWCPPPWRREETNPGRSTSSRRRRARRSTTRGRGEPTMWIRSAPCRVLAVPARLPGDARAVGRPKTSRVTKGPKPRPPSRVQPSGNLHVGRSHRGSP